MRCHRLFVPFLITVLIAPGLCLTVAGQTPPTFESATFFGGAVDQRGMAITIKDSQIYISGHNSTSAEGLIVRYSSPPGGPVWFTTVPIDAQLYGAAVLNDKVYAAGAARPSTCGASDGVGGTESKSMFSWFDRAAGTPSNCRSQNFFPYRGWEEFNSALVVGSDIYAGGDGEERGWGGWRTILAKFAPDGTLLWKRSFTTDSSGNPVAGTYTRVHSSTWGLASLNGYLYLAGHDRGAENIGGPRARAMLLKYDAASQPNDPNPNADGAQVLVPVWEGLTAHFDSNFMGVVAFQGNLYTAGYFNRQVGPPNADYLLEKYDESGALVWTQTWGGTGNNLLKGIVGVGDQLFAVGYTNSGGAGGYDMVIFEIDPATGDRLTTTFWGDAQDDMANGAATDGTDLYVIGESRSFASPEGNVVGQNDMVLLRYSVVPTNQPPVANAGADQTVECRASGCAAVTLDGSGSSDPDNDSLTYEWKEGENVLGTSAILTLSAVPLGTQSFTLTVNDGKGGTASDGVAITVQDTTPPALTLAHDSTTVVLPSAGAAGASVNALSASGGSTSDQCDPHPTLAPAGSAQYPLGSTIVQITATDATGNSSAKPFTVKVVYNFAGFLPPVKSDGTSIFKAGRTIPVKIRLTAADGSIVSSAVATLSVAKVSDQIIGIFDEAESAGASNMDNLFRYDPTAGQYIYNLSASGWSAGTYLLRAHLNDGTDHDVYVSIR